MQKFRFLIIILSSVLFLSACTPNYLRQENTPEPEESPNLNSNANTMKNDKYSEAPSILPEAERTGKKVVMKTNKGTIEIELYGDKAPLTVSNFIFLTKDKFYDGLTFHRVEKDIEIIQGGDPLGTGSGGPGYTISEEPPASGSDYKEGIIAMAKTAAPNSTGSQFFIMTGDFTGFNPEYSIFGKVISGMDVVKSIGVGDVMDEVKIENL